MTDQKRMLIIVPTRSRPENVEKVVRAWEETDAFRHADLLFAYDQDDPKRDDYDAAIWDCPIAEVVEPYVIEQWMPLVPKLNQVAMDASDMGYFAIGFAGDDHLPRTPDWAMRYLRMLLMMETGIVSCPDGYRPDRLPTQWAMTADIVRALGRMVPAPVEHLYCDNAVQDLAEAAGCYAYLDDVLIEHMHPLAGRGKAKWDDQYRHVNRPEQYRQDEEAYRMWRESEPFARWRMDADVSLVRGLRSGGTAPNPPAVPSGAPVCEHGYQLSARSIEIGIPVHMGTGKLCGAGSPNIATTERVNGDTGS